MSANSTSKDFDLRQFNTFITRLEGGALNEELTEKVKKCVQEIADACADRGGMFYCDADGNLTRENPRQLTLEDELARKRLADAEKAGQTA